MLKKLSEILEKNGAKYLDSMLNDKVTITEKLDTFRLIFEKKDGEFKFYKKDNTPITLVERLLNDVYEDALIEIPIIAKNAPEGYFFGVYYTPVDRPLRIPYSKLPKYVLTDVTKKSVKVAESLHYDQVKEWAGILCMGRPPIIFEGKLTDEQKKTLIAYDTRDYDNDDASFPEMVERLFHSTFSQENIIEGIIIKSGDKIAQIISYEFDILNEAYEKAHNSRAFYDLIITDVTQFLSTYSIPILESESEDQLYIDIVSDIFNGYCKEKNISEGIQTKDLTPPQFGHQGKLLKHLIKNEETLKLVNESKVNEALFKVFVSSFRKAKKPYGLLTESIVTNFNAYVNLINGYVHGFDDDMGWMEQKHTSRIDESRSDNIVVNAIKKRSPNDVDNMRVIASIQRAFEPHPRDVVKGEHHCAVYVTTFDPFTNSQLTNIQHIAKMWNCPVIIFGISSKNKVKGEFFYASDDLIKAQMRTLLPAYRDLIAGYALLDTWSLSEIFEYCRPAYEPIVVITDKGKKSEMALQLFFEEEVMGGRINVEENFNVGELDNEDRFNVVRSVEDNNFVLFKELTPPAIHNIMESFFSEYRYWSGQMLKPIND
jgi:hypothetical protein